MNQLRPTNLKGCSVVLCAPPGPSRPVTGDRRAPRWAPWALGALRYSSHLGLLSSEVLLTGATAQDVPKPPRSQSGADVWPSEATI